MLVKTVTVFHFSLQCRKKYDRGDIYFCEDDGRH